MEGFEVKVPITLKGGQEGEKVGKQIGEKIAAQLNKTFKAVKIGGGETGPSGMLGVTKGLKGVATKLGIVGAAIAGILSILSKASPYLKGILNIFGRAFLMFFRPFGDFLATLLRPMAILLMKAAVAFIKWLRPGGVIQEGAEKAPQLPEGALGTGKLGIGLTNFVNKLLRIGGSIGQILFDIGKVFFDIGGKIGQWLYDAIIKPLFDFGGKIGQWIYDKVIVPAGEFLADKIIGAWNWIMDFPGWLWEQITSIWTWTLDFGSWLWEQVTSIWSWNYNFGSWLWEQIKSIVTEDIPRLFKLIFPGGQVGIPNVPREGLYHLHQGEQVISRTKATNKSVILNPTFQFTGNVSKDIDIDAIARRAGRITEMELKQRGII